MKKITKKQRERDVKYGIFLRKRNKYVIHVSRASINDSWKQINDWIDGRKGRSLNLSISKKRKITLRLPSVMNFFEEYNSTILYISAIRKLSESTSVPAKAYRLASVNFDDLRSISTSAALVLTAELSKWDDTVRQKLRPMIDNWDDKILKQFVDLGFFELFRNGSIDYKKKVENSSNIRLVKYIKGQCGDNSKARILKNEIVDIIGDSVSKWTFLHSGLTEAITNVSHHAYPDKYGFSNEEKNWYLTGSYNENTKELKIVFYDQGIGIPKSLPASDIWEKVLSMLSGFSSVEKKKDEVLLKAAVELDRTSTEENDRGKGLQDLLEFIRQRKDGYLSILSLRGLFKFSMRDGKEVTKSEHFDHAICGTLIIWSARLND